MEVHTRKIELLCEFLLDFRILGLYLTVFSLGIVTRICETLGVVAHIRCPILWRTEVYTQPIEVLCEFPFVFYVLGLELTAFSPGITARSFEMHRLAVHTWHLNMWRNGVHTQKTKLFCEFLLNFHVLGL